LGENIALIARKRLAVESARMDHLPDIAKTHKTHSISTKTPMNAISSQAAIRPKLDIPRPYSEHCEEILHSGLIFKLPTSRNISHDANACNSTIAYQISQQLQTNLDEYDSWGRRFSSHSD
jgi:hypothetical protein